MKKQAVLLLMMLFLIVQVVNAAVTLRYYNKDSKSYKFKVKIAGSTKTVEFGASKKSSVTIQGGDEECIIYTECGEVKVAQGDKITIKDGCITIN